MLLQFNTCTRILTAGLFKWINTGKSPVLYISLFIHFGSFGILPIAPRAFVLLVLGVSINAGNPWFCASSLY